MALNPNKIQKKEFDNLMFVIEKPDDVITPLRKLHPNMQLLQYDEFAVDVTNIPGYGKYKDEIDDLLFKYIVLVYDMNSPFVKYARNNLQERKRYVLYYIGVIEELNDALDVIWTEIVSSKYYFVNRMILRYCILQRDSDWVYYCMTQERLYKYLLDSMTNVSMSKECKQIRNDLNEVRNQLLLGDDKRLEQDLERYVGELQYPISPEAIADYLQNNQGESPFDKLKIIQDQEIEDPYKRTGG